MISLSVLICTHQPREQFLTRVLQGLAVQTLAREHWELLLVDNRSTPPVEPRFDLSWHPQGKHVPAPKIGKTHAIAEGIRHAAAEVIVIVDDDNVLAADYLENARRLMGAHEFLGVIGGRVEGEFETLPPAWTRRYFPILALSTRDDEQAHYVCSPDKTCVPPGAGMVIRKDVVEHYLEQIAHDPIRQSLDPVGDELSRAGDTDMALCAWDLRLAKGYFPELKLLHLMPAGRLEPQYLARLFEGTAYCDTLLQLIRGMTRPEDQSPFWPRLRRHLAWRFSVWNLNRHQLKIDAAGRRGMLRAHRTFLARPPAVARAA